MISPPSRGKPQDPRNESQIDPGPIIDPPVFPQISIPGGTGSVMKAKCKPGKFGGRVLRVGKK